MDFSTGEAAVKDATFTPPSSPDMPSTETAPADRYVLQKRRRSPPPGELQRIPAAKGANNVGLLIAIYGTVTHSEHGFFYVDDGSLLDDGSSYIGVKVLCQHGMAAPNEGDHIIVTGISSIEPINSTTARKVIRVRRQQDMKPLATNPSGNSQLAARA